MCKRPIQLPYLSGLLLSLFLALASCQSSQEEPSQKPPNIVFIISDDQAWSDYSFMGHSQIETPRIDQLAKESLTFTRGYVTAPLCSPSLATIITGLYPHQHSITGNDPQFDFDGQRYSTEWQAVRSGYFSRLTNSFYQNTLLTERLEKQNYRSLQTGKWWLGSFADGHFSEGMTHGDYKRGGRHGDDGLKIGREGLDTIYSFIDKAHEADQPFLVWYAPFLPHTPHTPPAALEEKYLKRAPSPAVARYWAMCEWFDHTCGDLLDYLEEKGISDETLVVYACDNGWIQDPERPNRYASRSKRTPYEAGIRTPLMFKWPGKIKPHLDSVTLTSTIDIVPTVMAACGLQPDEHLPGTNLMDENKLKNRSSIFAEAYEHDIEDVEQPTKSLQYRIGLHYPWKLIVPNAARLPEEKMELFNTLEDPMETNNLIDTYPEQAEKLNQEIDQWWNPKSSN